jgi:crotonobetainyl-CoA:carnitine CoA-transferase CaiB-like acyl-CoA transferase
LLKLAIVNIEQIWPRFGPAIGRPEITDDPRWETTEIRMDHTAALIALIDEQFAQHDWAYWKERLTEYDIPYSQISSYEEVAEDPQYHANDTFVEYHHPQHGPIKSVGHPINIQGGRSEKSGAPPELGEHTEEVLKNIGYPDDSIQSLLEKGVAGKQPE